MWINIPFAEVFRYEMLGGMKTATCRRRQYGKAGDSFHAFGAVFVLDDVIRVYLWRVAYFSYRREGFNTREGFIDFWKYLHPDIGFKPNSMVYFHMFHMEKEVT